MGDNVGDMLVHKIKLSSYVMANAVVRYDVVRYDVVLYDVVRCKWWIETVVLGMALQIDPEIRDGARVRVMIGDSI